MGWAEWPAPFGLTDYFLFLPDLKPCAVFQTQWVMSIFVKVSLAGCTCALNSVHFHLHLEMTSAAGMT